MQETGQKGAEMSLTTMDRVLGMAQAYIVGLEAPEWLKKGLQEYSNRPSFRHRVGMFMEQGIVDEAAVELVLDEWARHMYLEFID